jgi:hypothetical protein
VNQIIQKMNLLFWFLWILRKKYYFNKAFIFSRFFPEIFLDAFYFVYVRTFLCSLLEYFDYHNKFYKKCGYVMRGCGSSVGYDHGSIWRLSAPKVGGSNLHPVILFGEIFLWKEKIRWFMGVMLCVVMW